MIIIRDYIFHPAGAHAQLRNAMLTAMSPDDMYDSLAWLYGGTGLSEDPATAAIGSAKAGPA